jgi:aminoglycoside phosphotransferase (APT) family kinase protein
LPSQSQNNVVSIDVPLVTRLVADQFPQWAHLSIAPVKLSGWDNRTFHLGEKMTIRLPSAEHYANAVSKEQCWLPRLAPHLPLPIPTPLALGQPDGNYPWQWSVYRWLDGEIATPDGINDLNRFAGDLADFLCALQHVDARQGPARKLRGGSLEIWNDQAKAAIEILSGAIDTKVASVIWNAAIAAPLSAKPVWYHGDVAAGNLLVEQGELSAVIDFGGLGVGDPACDMTIAWTLLDPSSRKVFRERLGVDVAIWERGRGWALWKGMIILANIIETNAVEAASAQYAVDQLLIDHNRYS